MALYRNETLVALLWQPALLYPDSKGGKSIMLPAGVSPHAFNHELSHQAMHSLKAGEVCSRKLYSNWDVLIATNKPHFTKNISIIELTTFLPYILREDPLKTLTDFFFLT